MALDQSLHYRETETASRDAGLIEFFERLENSLVVVDCDAAPVIRNRESPDPIVRHGRDADLRTSFVATVIERIFDEILKYTPERARVSMDTG